MLASVARVLLRLGSGTNIVNCHSTGFVGESSEVSKDKVVRTFDSFASIMNVPKYTQRLIMTRMELAATYLSIEQINLVVYEYIGSPDAPEDEDID